MRTMSLLNRYLIREIVKVFGLIFTLVVGIFVAVDYLGTMDEFLQADISLLRAFLFVMLKVPFVAVQLIPVALLLAVLVVFGLMSKNNEIIIIKSSGISVYRLVKPVLILGVCFSAVLVLMAEIMVPVTMAKANHIKYREIRKEANAVFRDQDIWTKGNREITHIKFFRAAEQSIFGFTRFYFDQNFRLLRRLDAEKGVYRAGRWQLENVMELSLNPATGEYDTIFNELTADEPLGFKPADLQEVVKRSEEMNFRELLQFIGKVEREGYDANDYRVDLYGKTAFPFVCIIMSLMGIGLTARGKLSKGLPVAISYGIGIAFLYWVFYSFCLSLGYGELLPPMVAAWIANIVFFIAGVVLLISAE